MKLYTERVKLSKPYPLVCGVFSVGRYDRTLVELVFSLGSFYLRVEVRK